MKRIFVVDDEADINLTINTALEENGFEVNAYDDPVIALDNFRKGAYHLLIAISDIAKNKIKLIPYIKCTYCDWA